MVGRTGRRTSFDRVDDEFATAGRPQGMFVDVAAMKEKLRENMIKPEYDVRNYYKTEGFCQLVARANAFETLTLTVIGLNALWLAIDADCNTSTMLLDAHPVFQIGEHFFCAYFSFEWTMRFGAFQHKRHCLKDVWFLFDSCMVVMMVGETWVMSVVLVFFGSSRMGGMGNAGMFRLLRLLRLTRMARMAKLLRSMPELLILIKGMASAMRSVLFTLLLLVLIIYVFAILFRQLTTDTVVGEIYFRTIFLAMHTLLLDGTLLDGTGNVVGEMLVEELYFLVFLFYLFVLLASLTVMNMLIGVLCEVVSAVAATERESIVVEMLKDGFIEILGKDSLESGDMMISKAEFEQILQVPKAVHLLDQVGVDVYGVVDLADWIFKGDENNEELTRLSFPDFVDLILSLRGANTATVGDIVGLRKFIYSAIHDIEAKISKHFRRDSLRASHSATSSASIGHSLSQDSQYTPFAKFELQVPASISVSNGIEDAGVEPVGSLPGKFVPLEPPKRRSPSPPPAPPEERQQWQEPQQQQQQQLLLQLLLQQQEQQEKQQKQQQEGPAMTRPPNAALGDQLWLRAARLEGVLGAARGELEGFVQSLPRARCSPPPLPLALPEPVGAARRMGVVVVEETSQNCGCSDGDGRPIASFANLTLAHPNVVSPADKGGKDTAKPPAAAEAGESLMQETPQQDPQTSLTQLRTRLEALLEDIAAGAREVERLRLLEFADERPSARTAA